MAATTGKQGWLPVAKAIQRSSTWRNLLLVSEDERLEISKKQSDQPVLSAHEWESVMGKLQEEQIQQQINFYNKRNHRRHD